MFKDMIAGLVKDGVALLDDLNERFTYRHFLGQAYDPVTGRNEIQWQEIEALEAPFTKFSLREVDNTVNTITDCKVLIPSLDLPAGFEPNENDVIITDKGKRWNVQKLLGVPGESIHIIHVRRVPNV